MRSAARTGRYVRWLALATNHTLRVLRYLERGGRLIFYNRRPGGTLTGYIVGAGKKAPNPHYPRPADAWRLN